jgi:ADP-heptose:LPS heptosyltransferase
MGMGDEIMATGHAQRVYEEGGRQRRVAICDNFGAPRWHALWEGNPILAHPTEVAAGEQVIQIKNASFCRPYIQYPFTKETGWHWTDWRASENLGRLFFTPKELALARKVREAGPYVFVEPTTRLENKDWGVDNYVQVMRQFPGVRFVRTSFNPVTKPIHVAEILPGLNFRQAVAVIALAEAYLGAEGGCHHAAAVMGIPGVVVFGGAISAWNLGYPLHANITGEGPPCGRYLPCDHCRGVLNGIRPEQVAEALREKLTCLD